MTNSISFVTFVEITLVNEPTMKHILLCVCLCSFFSAFSQDFTYSFRGEISDTDLLESKLLALPDVGAVKFRYKQEKMVGEILLFLKEKNLSRENEENFSPVEVKKILIDAGLQPNQFTVLKK